MLKTSLLLSVTFQIALLSAAQAHTTPPPANSDTPAAHDTPADTVHFDRHGMIATAERFFGDASSGMAEAIEKAFDTYGTPTGYIAGEEMGAAFFGGVRYGQGVLTRKDASGEDKAMTVYWQGPSAGYDFGAHAAKSFFLVYDLQSDADIFQRFPSVDGNFYLGAGVGMTYKRAAGVTLVPLRAGLGIRGGASVGYVHFTREASWLPF